MTKKNYRKTNEMKKKWRKKIFLDFSPKFLKFSIFRFFSKFLIFSKFWKIWNFSKNIFFENIFRPEKNNIFRWDFFKSSSRDPGESLGNVSKQLQERYQYQIHDCSIRMWPNGQIRPRQRICSSLSNRE